jgi:uncharacterized protein
MKGEGYRVWKRNSRAWQSWRGLAFESVCLKHIAQIDLVIDRADSCINLCEMKYSDHTFTITKPYAENLRRKLRLFRDTTKTHKNLFLTILTTHGCAHNPYYEEIVETELPTELKKTLSAKLADSLTDPLPGRQTMSSYSLLMNGC